MKKIDYNDRKLVCIPVVTSFRILMAPDMERNVRFDVSVWLYAAGVCSDIKICAVFHVCIRKERQTGTYSRKHH